MGVSRNQLLEGRIGVQCVKGVGVEVKRLQVLDLDLARRLVKVALVKAAEKSKDRTGGRVKCVALGVQCGRYSSIMKSTRSGLAHRLLLVRTRMEGIGRRHVAVYCAGAQHSSRAMMRLFVLRYLARRSRRMR